MKNCTLPIAMMFALFFTIAFVTGLQNPMGIIVKNQFQASNFLSQFGNFANFIAYACVGIPAGLLLQRVGYKKTALTGIVFGIAGVAITFLSGRMGSFPVYLLGAFVAGISICMMNTTVNPMLNTLGGGGKKGNQLLQFGGACNSVGATIAPLIVGIKMGRDISKASISDANLALLIAAVIFILAFLVIFLMKIPEPYITKENSSTNAEEKKYSPLSFRHFILGATAIFVYVGTEVGIPNISNLYMTSDLKIDTAVAGTIVGTYWFLMLVGRFIGGLVGSKISSKTMLVFAACLGIVLVITAIMTPKEYLVEMPVFKSDISFGLTKVPVSIMLLILCGFCTSVMWGGIFNLATAGLGKYTSAASGIFMVMVCGGGILPAVQGWAADMFGYIESYWVIALGFTYILLYTLFGSKNVNTDIKVD